MGPEADQEASVQLGRACEALRNLIVEAGCKLNELEETKQTFFSIVDPAAQALRALEHEKTRNISLNRRLGLLRASSEALQAKYDQVEKRAETLAADKDQLRLELEEAQRIARELRAIKAELTNDLLGVRATAANLEHQVTDLSSRARSLTEDNQRYRTQAIEIEAHANALESDLNGTRETLAWSRARTSRCRTRSTRRASKSPSCPSAARRWSPGWRPRQRASGSSRPPCRAPRASATSW